MKKALFLISFCFSFTLSYSQVKFGVKSGINFTKIADKEIEYDFKVSGIYIGGFANIPFAEKFAFQPELLYSMQGAKSDKYEITELDGGSVVITEYAKIEHKLDYINLPLMIRYNVINNLFFEFGPQLGFVVKNEVELKSATFGNQKFEPNSNLDFGIVIGAEYEFYKGLGVTIRYNRGLTDINKNSNWSNKNSVISTGLSYRFN